MLNVIRKREKKKKKKRDKGKTKIKIKKNKRTEINELSSASISCTIISPARARRALNTK